MHSIPDAPFLIVEPLGRELPVVLSSPHSGRHYPESLLRQLRFSVDQLRALNDGPVDGLLFQGCTLGATLCAATYARVVVDLNRGAHELDPAILADPAAVPDLQLTMKARAGLGVVPTQLMGRPIYRQRLTSGELRQRLATVYTPFHARLHALLRERRARFADILLLDCHSMPTLPSGVKGERPVDVALGDRFGHSCHPGLIEAAERLLGGAGLTVARNRPFAGGYITSHYGRPATGVHALQLELRRDLFMHEATHEPNAGYAGLQSLLGRLVRVLADAVQALAGEATRATAVPAPSKDGLALTSA